MAEFWKPCQHGLFSFNSSAPIAKLQAGLNGTENRCCRSQLLLFADLPG